MFKGRNLRKCKVETTWFLETIAQIVRANDWSTRFKGSKPLEWNGWESLSPTHRDDNETCHIYEPVDVHFAKMKDLCKDKDNKWIGAY